jgi:hypothetical protein
MNVPFTVTEEETRECLGKYFEEGDGLKLKSIPTKYKKEFIVIRRIAEVFDKGRTYTEKEVNALLAPIYHEHVIIRRMLVDFGFLQRKADGSAYWSEKDIPASEQAVKG